MNDLITVKETAEYLRIPLPTVYYLVQRGQLPAVQIGGRWRVKKSLIDSDILRRRGETQPTVLVVDDDLGLQEMFKLFLKKAGFSRVIVGTGKEAIAALSKKKFDLCFLDLMLPDIMGDEVFKVAKAKHPSMPVVIITGYPDSEILDNILKLGPVTVLKKPLKVNQLSLTLKMLGHRVTGKSIAA
jgi:excisionase family DNA binding protein